ncbi:MAG: hypothetical protein A3I75_02290 [Deltaproteobacteria bacterium RIFCSPLOWO2_02_FULL_50_16]|nr:MAG: hypothetical protein A2053_05140 [Deltaproteobacteria bacterium GWA2_50_8]OGQ25757.1 MAG: hypothetical protein A3B79_06170 [Deltaproteobacteria bacterium RIFCSPHIGHO2_02_FULL_50_15]OGQ57017.1 MAG: hypothetical protein A3I75_02290 [Deltaproteobacteria bacterium RIFCSPLOWO2_02_FULL_50_16]OGQ68666.1 MAG: hypothetical protein A3F89_02990 [Deltaproteobacteria bacterium RIFCSPLOWO2_12_FULL_50_11]
MIGMLDTTKTLIVHVPNIRSVDKNPEICEVRYMAMGLFAMASLLAKNNIPVKIINLATELKNDPDFDLIRYLEENRCQLVAFSLQWAHQLYQTLETARAIKQAFPDIKVLLGGMTASYYSVKILEEYPFVDFVVKGDGERPLLELVKQLSLKNPCFEKVSNLVYRHPSRILENPITYIAHEADMNRLSFSDMELLHHYKGYLEDLPFNDNGFIPHGFFPLCIGRGCHFNCTFCGGSARSQYRISGRKKYVYRNPENVLYDIKKLLGFGIENFYVCFDPEPNGPYYFHLFEIIRKAHLHIYMNFGAWGLPTEKFVDAFKQTFQKGIFEISPESADERIRKKNKDSRLFYSNKQLEKAMGSIEDENYTCHVYFAHTLPGDSIGSIKKTIQYIENLQGKFSSKIYYLTLSSDPGALLQICPEKYDVDYRINHPRDLYEWIHFYNQTQIFDNAVFHLPQKISNEDFFVQQALYHVWSVISKIYPGTYSILKEKLGVSEILDILEGDLLRPHYHRVYKNDFDGNITFLRDSEILQPDQYSNLLLDLLNRIPESYFHERQLVQDVLKSSEVPLILRGSTFTQVVEEA